ncbi:MAG: hypothetical protein ACRDSR_13970 [Pseudonocardiaceae bacterium]
MADTELLHAHSRPANADHLAGMAAECALKALIAGFLGGHVNQDDLVVHPDTGKAIKNHISAARTVVGILERAHLDGMLT